MALLASSLGSKLHDPVDRLVITTALQHEALLITADKVLPDWGTDLKRHDAETCYPPAQTNPTHPPLNFDRFPGTSQRLPVLSTLFSKYNSEAS